MAKDTADWFGASLQQRRRLQTVLWYDGFFLMTPLDHTPYRRMGMSYQVAELVVPALAHVVGSGITVDCGIMCVRNGNIIQHKIKQSV
jgi:hypothetical protein